MTRQRTRRFAGLPVDSELGQLMAETEEEKGEGTILSGTARPTMTHCPFGIFVLDMAMLGGLPEGFTTCIYGWESTGKTTVALKAVAGMQRKYPDQRVLWVDLEGTLDRNWARQLGVDLERFLVTEPSHGEQALDIMKSAMEARETSLIVLDSVAAIAPTKPKEASAEDKFMGTQAGMMSEFMRSVTSVMIEERKRGHWPSLLLLNQFRMSIGKYGDPRVLPAGYAIKFFSIAMVEIKNKEKLGRDSRDVEVPDHNEHSFTMTKMKGTSIRHGEFILVRNPDHDKLSPGDIDEARTVLTYAKKFGVLTGGGAHWELEGIDQVFRRLSDLEDALLADLEFYAELKLRLLSMQRGFMGQPSEGWY